MAGGTAPTVLNAANEEAVARFLGGDIRFSDIWRLTETVLERMPAQSGTTLPEIMEADGWARREAARWRPVTVGGPSC